MNGGLFGPACQKTANAAAHPAIPAAILIVIPAKAGIPTPIPINNLARAPTVIPAQAGIQNPGKRSPTTSAVVAGRGVDSRFRGNYDKGWRE